MILCVLASHGRSYLPSRACLEAGQLVGTERDLQSKVAVLKMSVHPQGYL